MKKKTGSQLIIETNRRLQETAQKLFMAKKELEKKNKELEKARQREQHQKEQLQNELDALKHLAGPGLKKKVEPIPEKKLTKSIAEDLSLRYLHILESYIKTKDLDKSESLVDELCRKLMEYDITPKGIISLHLKSSSQIKTIGDLETKRATFESRMVLLKVMTQYASLLHGLARTETP